MQRVSVFSLAKIPKRCRGPLTPHLDHLAPNLTTKTNSHEVNLEQLAASQWWQRSILHLTGYLYSPTTAVTAKRTSWQAISASWPEFERPGC